MTSVVNGSRGGGKVAMVTHPTTHTKRVKRRALQRETGPIDFTHTHPTTHTERMRPSENQATHPEFVGDVGGRDLLKKPNTDDNRISRHSCVWPETSNRN